MAEIEMLNSIVDKIAEELSYTNYNLKIVPISSGGANYTSTLYNVTLEEPNRSHHMFVKVAAMGKEIRSQTPDYYNTEIFFYTKLAKIYENLQNEHQVPNKHRLNLPKFYACNPTIYKETVVLENLVIEGYQAYDRLKSIEWEYAASAITELSKLHALSFAYSEACPDEFNKVVDNLKFDWNSENDKVMGYFENAVTRAIDMVEEKSKDKLRTFLETFGKSNYGDFYRGSYRPVLTHGDFRPSNLMHRVRNDGTIDIKIVDLQTMQGASPIVDLLYFIFTGSDEDFRAQYYEKLIDHYYMELQTAMRRLSLNPEKVYSRTEFDHELKEKLPFGLTVAVFVLPLVTVAPEDAPKVDKDMQISTFSEYKTSNLYTERLNGVLNDYMKWGFLN